MKSFKDYARAAWENANFPAVSDSLLSGFCSFLLSSFVLSYFKIGMVLTLSLSVVTAVIVCFAVFKVKSKKYRNAKSAAAHGKKLSATLAELELMPDNRLIALFSSLFKKAGIEHETHEKSIVTKTCTYFFDYAPVTDRRSAAGLIRNATTNCSAIFCAKPSDDLLALQAENPATIFIADASVLSGLLEKYDADFPKKEINVTIKQKMRGLKSKIFAKKRAGAFCFSSACLLFFSYFSFFPFYYRLCGFALLLPAIFCLVSNKTQGAADKKCSVLPDF